MNALSWNILKVFAAQTWPDFKAKEIHIKLDAKTFKAEVQARHHDSASTRVSRPLQKAWVEALAARYAKLAPLSRIDYATVHVNYWTNQAHVRLYYVSDKGEKLSYTEQHDIK